MTMVEWSWRRTALEQSINQSDVALSEVLFRFLVRSPAWMIRGQPQREDIRKPSESQTYITYVVGLYVAPAPTYIIVHTVARLKSERGQPDNSCKQ